MNTKLCGELYTKEKGQTESIFDLSFQCPRLDSNQHILANAAT